MIKLKNDAGCPLKRYQHGLRVAALVALALPAVAQTTGQPVATLQQAPAVAFPNTTDSNSPAVWERIDGQWILTVLNSVDGQTRLSRGPSVTTLQDYGPVSFTSAAPLGGYWFEALIQDAGAWYGFYHNEIAETVCGESGKVLPRIGAARSEDLGQTWTDLGLILELPPGEELCDTLNHYFVGGVGDFSALLDADSTYVHFYYSQYAEISEGVGVSAARMAWADRDEPRGRVEVWSDGAWLPARAISGVLPGEDDLWLQPLATPVLPARDSWDNASPTVDVFWGPSVHWNTHINTYVMLLNRATSAEWEQGGIYVSYNDDLANPDGWSTPVRLLSGGDWYPQVVGLGSGQATDTYAGSPSRFFMSGRSEYTIRFERR